MAPLPGSIRTVPGRWNPPDNFFRHPHRLISDPLRATPCPCQAAAASGVAAGPRARRPRSRAFRCECVGGVGYQRGDRATSRIEIAARGCGHRVFHRRAAHNKLSMGYTSLLDLSNYARAAAATGDSATASNAITEIEGRLRLPRRSIESELHGRKPVDALLNLALAGCDESWLFRELSSHAEDEVRRWGRRRSCTAAGVEDVGRDSRASALRLKG